MAGPHEVGRDRRTVALAGLVLCLVLVGSTGAIAASAGASPSPGLQPEQSDGETADEPPNASYVVVVEPRAPGDALIEVETTYEVRTEAELRRARNETLETDWFRGEAIVDRAMAARGEPSDAVDHRPTNVVVPAGDDATSITVSHRAHWTGFMEPDENRTVLGPGFASALEDGDVFRVELAVNEWSNWTVNREDEDWQSEAVVQFSWTIGTDPEPRFELERADYGTESYGLGPVPLVLPALALLLVAALRVRRS